MVRAMYNPQNLHQCEVEKQRNPRELVDNMMIVVGIVASLSSLPQVLKIWQTQSVASISLTTYLIAAASVLAWLAYGVYIKNKPLIYTTSVTIVINFIVIIQIFIYG